MDAKWVPEKHPVRIYEVVILLAETVMSVICANVRGDDDGFLVCDPCPELSSFFVERCSVSPKTPRIKLKTWINKRQIHTIEELGEINE